MSGCARVLAVCCLFVAIGSSAAAQFLLTTTFAGGNGSDGNMFDIVATNQVVIRGFDLNLDAGSWDVEIYKRRMHGSFVGSETTPGDWKLISAPRVTSLGAGVATPLDLDLAVWIPATRTQAFYVTVTGGSGINYTNGTAVGAVFASDSNIQILEGVGKSYPFGSTFAPRVWNGTVRYATPVVVPGPFVFGIQSGINVAPMGGAVLVTAGTYNETIDFMGKSVAVVSRSGSGMTTIDAMSAGTVVTIDGPDAALEGFTVTGGQGAAATVGGIEADFGAAIRECQIENNTGGNAPGPFGRGGAGGVHGSATMFECILRNNSGGVGMGGAAGGAGGIYARQTTRLRDCLIEDNDGGLSVSGAGGAGGFALDPIDTGYMWDCEIRGNDGGNGTRGGAGGMAWLGDSAGFFSGCRIHGNTGGTGSNTLGGAGGVDCPGGQGSMVNSLIYGNMGGASTLSRGGGGGFNFQFDTGAAITHCTVTGNTGGSGAVGPGPGGALFFGVIIASPDLTNCIVWGNPGLDVLEVLLGPNAEPADITYCDIQGGWPGIGNISADPVFTDASMDDYHLQAASPCFDAGTASAPSLPATDFDGQPRIQFGAPDMGVDEIAIPFLPGSGEDLRLEVRINGTLDVQASAGDFFDARIFSPGFTFVGDPAALVGQVFTTGSPPAGLGNMGLPYVHIDPAGLVIFLDQTSSPLGPVIIPPAGVTLPYVVPMGLGGMTLRLQGLAFSSMALNGVFAATGAWDVAF